MKIYQQQNGNIVVESNTRTYLLPFGFFFLHPSVENAVLISNKTDLEDERAGLLIEASVVEEVGGVVFSGNANELLEVISKKIKVSGSKK